MPERGPDLFDKVLRIDGASVVISSSTSSSSATPAARKEPALGYIPLEPEAPDDEEPR